MRLHIGKATAIIREYYGSRKIDSVVRIDYLHYLVRFIKSEDKILTREEIVEMYEKLNNTV